MGEYYTYPTNSQHNITPALTIILKLPYLSKSLSLFKTISWRAFGKSYGRFYVGSIDRNKLIIEVILLT